MSRIALAPPRMLSDCTGGFTWNGRTASTSCTVVASRVRFFSSYRATRRETSREPDANAVTRSSHDGCRHVTPGIGSEPSSRNGRVSTSAQLTTRESVTTNGSMEKPRLDTSSAPSADRRPLSAPASMPTTVHAVCSPDMPRGYVPRGASRARASNAAFGEVPNHASLISSSVTP